MLIEDRKLKATSEDEDWYVPSYVYSTLYHLPLYTPSPDASEKFYTIQKIIYRLKLSVLQVTLYPWSLSRLKLADNSSDSL